VAAPQQRPCRNASPLGTGGSVEARARLEHVAAQQPRPCRNASPLRSGGATAQLSPDALPPLGQHQVFTMTSSGALSSPSRDRAGNGGQSTIFPALGSRSPATSLDSPLRIERLGGTGGRVVAPLPSPNCRLHATDGFVVSPGDLHRGRAAEEKPSANGSLLLPVPGQGQGQGQIRSGCRDRGRLLRHGGAVSMPQLVRAQRLLIPGPGAC